MSTISAAFSPNTPTLNDIELISTNVDNAETETHYEKTSAPIYKYWQGNNELLFKGRVIFGSDKLLLISLFLLLIPTLAFPAQVWPYFILHQHPALTAVIIFISVGGLIVVASSLFLTAGSDPGIIPRKEMVCSNLYVRESTLVNQCGEIVNKNEASVQQISPKDDLSSKLLPPTFQTVIVNGKKETLKYCYTCHVYRPPRASHCQRCENCVERFDHHCPWTGTCIGRRNYRSYYVFVLSTTIMSIFIIAICILQVILVGVDEYTEVPANQDGGMAFAHILERCPTAIILFFYFIAIKLFTGSLTTFHTYLICINQTTYENIKQKNRSLYTKGVLKNLKEFFCLERWPRMLNMRNELPQPMKLEA